MLYYHLWPPRLYHIFQQYLIKGTIFGKNVLNIKCVLIFFTTSFETVLILRRIEREIIKVRMFSCNTHYSCQILTKFENFWTEFRKIHKY
jgi:hypothetical protein